LTSGGAGGQAIPTTADDVFFDAASGANIVGIATGNTGAKSINCTGFTGTLAGSGAITIAGSVTLVAAMGFTHSGTKTISGTATLTTAGKGFGNCFVNGAGITVTLNGSIISSITVSQGTFDTANFNVSLGSGALTSTGTLTRTINLGSSAITCSGTGTSLSFSGSNLTFNAGTSSFDFSGSSPTFAGGGYTFYNVTFSSAVSTKAVSVTGANTFNNFTCTGSSSVGTVSITFAANQIINGLLLLSAGIIRRLFVNSSISGTSRTLTAAAMTADNIDFKDITIGGAVAPVSLSLAGDAGNNSGITFTAPKTVYWNLAGSQLWSATGWALSSGGTPNSNNFPLAQDTAIFNNSGAITTITVNANWYVGTVNFSSRTSAMTLALSTNRLNLTGNFSMGSGLASTASLGSAYGAIVFSGVGTQQIISNGNNVTTWFDINSVLTTVQFFDTFTSTAAYGSTGVGPYPINLVAGTLDLNANTVTMQSFRAVGSARVLAFNGGTFNINGNNITAVFELNGTSFSYTGAGVINYTYSGSVGTRTITETNTSQTNAISHNITAGSDIVAFSSPFSRARNLTFDSGFTGTWTNGVNITLFGNLTLNSAMTVGAGTFTVTFGATSGTQTITSASKLLDFPISISAPGGTVQLADALTMGATRTLTLDAGIFNTNNQTVTCNIFSSSNTNTRTLTLGTSTINVGGTGTCWNFATVTGLTFSGALSTINLTNTTTSVRTFQGGGLTYGTLNIGGATGTSTLTLTNSAGTFATISSTKTVAHTISITANFTVTNWTITGTVGNVATITSSVNGTQRTITYTGGQTNINYMSFRDINFSYTLNASNPYRVYAGANSTNNGNNLGIAFIDGVTKKAYRLTTGTTWTVPSDWTSTNNIYLIGAGGGGTTSASAGNNRAAGGGGGGGGYTVLTNQTLTGAIPFTIGTSAGNTNGGSTTFNTTNIAGGGSVGTATTTPTSAGGAGGTGTFAGGTGGAGAVGTAASTGYGGGGGGGAGGPNGVGGNGGNGAPETSSLSISGGGGGGNGGGSNGGNSGGSLGGRGGNNSNGVGGAPTASNSPGTVGGGGCGGGDGFGRQGTSGGSGIDIQNTLGGGGGNGGSGVGNSSTNLGLYGGGGSGAGVNINGNVATGAAGSQGVIFIVYTRELPPSNGNFFFMFG
jgi:hypothetical protein